MTIAKQKPGKAEPFDIVATLVSAPTQQQLDKACRLASREQLDEAIGKIRGSGDSPAAINGVIAYLESFRELKCVDDGTKETRTDARLNEGPRSSPRNGAETSGEQGVSNTQDGTLRMFDPKTIRRSPFNRTAEDRNAQKQVELVESVRLHGIQQPGKVRPVNPPDESARGEVIAWELIMGEGRWLAAIEVGCQFPAIIADVDDTTAIEMQAVENLHRDDLNPLAEGEKYKQLLERYQNEQGMGATAAIEKLCQKVQKHKSTVYERLALLKLPEAAIKAIRSGRLPASHAGLIAKLDDHDMQVSATSEILKPKDAWDCEDGLLGEAKKDAIMSFRAAKQLIERKEKELERRKEFDRLKGEFEKNGGTVLDGKPAKKLFDKWGNLERKCGYVQTTSTCDGDGQYRSWKKALGKHAPAEILAQSPRGEAVLLYKVDEANAAKKKAGVKRSSSSSSSISRKKSPADTKAEEDQAKRLAAFNQLVPEVVRAAEGMDPANPQLWRFILDTLLRQGLIPCEEICERRQITFKGMADTALLKALEKANGKQLRGVIAEALFIELEPRQYMGKWDAEFPETCKVFGVKPLKWEQK